MNTRNLLLAMALAMTAGCSQEAPSPPPKGPAAAAPTEAVGAPVAGADRVRPAAAGAAFSMTPDSFRICDADNGAIASTAKWDVTAQHVAEVSIYVVDAKGEKKLWLDGGATGESTTGKWVFADSTFQLLDRKTGELMSEVAIKALPCP